MSSRRMGMAEALRDGMRVALRTDPSVFLLGEDLGVPGGFGGGFTVTLGLSEEFGHERIMDTPISEIAIVGAAVGAAMMGMRPVAEMQYGDFVFCAMDQVVNQAAKMHYMSAGRRLRGAAGQRRGPPPGLAPDHPCKYVDDSPRPRCGGAPCCGGRRGRGDRRAQPGASGPGNPPRVGGPDGPGADRRGGQPQR